MIRPEVFDFEPELGLKLGQTEPKISGTVPTNRHTTIPNDSGPVSACFDDDSKLLNCEIAQPNHARGQGHGSPTHSKKYGTEGDGQTRIQTKDGRPKAAGHTTTGWLQVPPV